MPLTALRTHSGLRTTNLTKRLGDFTGLITREVILAPATTAGNPPVLLRSHGLLSESVPVGQGYLCEGGDGSVGEKVNDQERRALRDRVGSRLIPCHSVAGKLKLHRWKTINID